jgi:hypothetical protein
MFEVAMRLNYQFMDDANVIMDGTQLWKLRPLGETDLLMLATAYFRTGDFASAAATAQAGVGADGAARKAPNAELVEILMNAEARLKEK